MSKSCPQAVASVPSPSSLCLGLTLLAVMHETHSQDKRILVGLSGIPGAGKSTITALVVDILNSTYTMKKGIINPRFAVSVPMDGFHFTRAHLRQMPQPEIAIHRRGAAFTYDADAFLEFVQSLRGSSPSTSSLTEFPVIHAPSFDHATKDPVPSDILIHPSSRVILIEGNYCALNREPWASAADLMDELWFIDTEREIARHRLAKRHVASGICDNLNVAYERIASTDFLNADEIVENLLPVQEMIRT